MGRLCRPGERRTERPYGRRINRWFARRPLAGAPASPASPESPAVFALPRRVSAPSPKHGVRSPPCPTGPQAGRAPCAHARPAPASPFLRVLCVLCDFQNNLAVLRVPSWFFVFFVSAPQGTSPTPSQRPHPSPACRALRSPFSVLCSPGRLCRPLAPQGTPFTPSQRPHLCGKHAAPLKNTLQKGLYLLS